MATRTNLKSLDGKVDLVPLVDVLFLLLIFFLISSTFVFQPGIPVDLPQVENAGVRAAEKILVTVTRSGLLFFNDKPVTGENLERELRDVVLKSRIISDKRLAENANSRTTHSPMLVLRADAQVPYKQIIEITSLARSLGLGVYLVTDVDKESIIKQQALP